MSFMRVTFPKVRPVGYRPCCLSGFFEAERGDCRQQKIDAGHERYRTSSRLPTCLLPFDEQFCRGKTWGAYDIHSCLAD